MRGKSTLLSLVALFSGLAASIGISQMFEEPAPEPVEIDQASILVAAFDIDVGEPISSRNVKLTDCPCNRIPADCLRDGRHLKSLFAGRRLKQGEPITRSDLQDSRLQVALEDQPAGYLMHLRVIVDAENAGAMQAGDRVQLAVVSKTLEDQEQTAQLVLNLALLQSVEAEIAREVLENGSRLVIKQVTLTVRESDISLLLLAQEVGRLQMAISDLPESSNPADNAACTMADLVAFVVDQNQRVAESSAQIFSQQEPALPAIHPQPTPPTHPQSIPPTVTPPVVKDVNTLGRTSQVPSNHPERSVEVLVPRDAGTTDSPASRDFKVQLTVTDKQTRSAATVTDKQTRFAAETTPRVDHDKLRE